MPALVLCLLFAAAGAAQSPRPPAASLPGLSQSFERIAEQVSPAVVQVIARGLSQEAQSRTPRLRDQRSSGSGVIVDTEGYIVTNAHVVGMSRRVQVLLPLAGSTGTPSKSILKPAGKLVEARLIGADRETDVAVLKVEQAGLRALRFGDSESLRQGQIVFAFGSPFGLENSMAMGVVSSPARQIRADDPMIYIQTDASINPGNSGGPLTDGSGALVGINTFNVSTSGASAGVGFAVPSNIVRTVYEQIRKNGRVRRGQVGVVAQTITPQLAEALQLPQDWGVLVGDVAPRSSAEAAGIEIKDLLLTLDGKVLENARQFGVNIYQRAGETVTLELLRGKEKLTRQVAVLERKLDAEQLLAKVGEGTLVPRLGLLALNLDEKVIPLLPELRRLSGVVVTGMIAEPSGNSDPFLPADVIYAVNHTKVANLSELDKALQSAKPGTTVAVQVERLGQLQYLVVEAQ